VIMGIQLAPDVGDRGFVFAGGVLHPYVTAAPDSQKGPEELLHRRGLSAAPQGVRTSRRAP
jgi:hypothetical protein